MSPMTMNRATSAATDHEAHEGLTEMDLQKLQRQYRMLEADRKAYSDESRLILHKQKGTIERMKKENNQLSEQIRLMEAMSEASKLVVSKGDKTFSFEEEKEHYKRRSKQLIQQIDELEGLIRSRTERIDEQRASLGGVNAASTNIDAIEKNSKILENRLDKALVKYNKSLATNKRLRVMIDNLRRERVTFDKLARKFEKEIAEQKRMMQELIEQSNAAYEARDEAQNRITILREKAEKEYQTYIQEVKDLDRNIEHDRKLREFLMTKSVDRAEKAAELAGDELRNAKREKHSMNARTSSNESLNTFLEQYEQMLKEIEKTTGISDIHAFITHFKAVEEDNFALFVYVNEINNESEKLATEYQKYQTLIAKMKKDESLGDAEKSLQVAQLEKQLAECEKRSETSAAQAAESTLILQTITTYLEKIVDLCKSIPSPFVDENETVSETQDDQEVGGKLKAKALLGHPQAKVTVTTDNIMQVLGLVEQEASDIMTLNHIFSYGKKNVNSNANANATTNGDGASTGNGEIDLTTAKVSMPLPGTVNKLLSSNPHPTQPRLMIAAPSTSAGEDDDKLNEEQDHIFSRSEIKDRYHTRASTVVKSPSAGNLGRRK